MEINSIGGSGFVEGSPPPTEAQRWVLAQNLIGALDGCLPLVRSNQIPLIGQIKGFMDHIVSQVNDPNIVSSSNYENIESQPLNQQLNTISGFFVALAPKSCPFYNDLINAVQNIGREAQQTPSQYSESLTLSFEKILTIVHGMSSNHSELDINGALAQLDNDKISFTQLDQNIQSNCST